MDKYKEDVLDTLKDRYIHLFGKKAFKKGENSKPFYLCDLNDNLIVPMSDEMIELYEHSSGHEISSQKMNAIFSSSAMTYNLFWDKTVHIIKNPAIKNGIYNISLEQQFYTLKRSVSKKPAHLDAFLYSPKNKEAVAVEMKMTEWLFESPGKLKKSYLKADNYIDAEAGEVFTAIAKALIAGNDYDNPETEKDEYSAITSRYDAFQMFKHTVACYTTCVEKAYDIDKLTLVNCVWMPTTPDIFDFQFRERYAKEEKEELEQFELFKKIMEPAKELFSTKGVQFDIRFYSFPDFVNLFHKTSKELNYLQRYVFF